MYTRQIESFIEAANAGSFSKAAKALYIAPSSLIQQIDLLEKRLHLTLFERGSRGVKLTEAGKSLYQDAVEIVRHSEEAIARAREKQNGGEAIRVATSLLMKCRLLPEIWSHMIEDAPGTKVDIISLERAGVEPGSYLRGLGISYDVMEGLYLSELYRDACMFLELDRTPLCLALPKSAIKTKGEAIGPDMLCNLDLVTMRCGVSKDYDAVHTYLLDNGARRITEVPYYTMGLFADCELNNKAIITTEIWKDVHPNLACIPLLESFSIPYGLIFPKNPSPHVMGLYRKAMEMARSLSTSML